MADNVQEKKKNHFRLENYLKNEKRAYQEYKMQPKLLILGSSDSGKSTLLKQMKIMHGNGFSDEERKQAAQGIKDNILTGIHQLLSGTESLDKENYVEFFDFYECWQDKEVKIPPHIIDTIVQLWKLPAVQEILKENKVRIPDTTPQFLENASKYLDESYIPTNDDILMLRTVTQHVSETIFTIKKKIVRFFDVSGLIHHRKTWLSYFDDVQTVLFVMSLASYDQFLAEDSTINMMVDSLVLFEQVINNPILSTPNFVLFFNKKDIYEKKIKLVPLNSFFPEYTGWGNKAIEKYLNEERKAYKIFKQHLKLLILGSSDSGKSTLLKQLKLMHGNGFTDKEKLQFAQGIKENIIHSLHLLVSNTEKLEKEKYAVFDQFYKDWSANPDFPITGEIAGLMANLWKEKLVQDTFDSDILNLRTVTQHISESVFNIDQRVVRFYDVSGLKYHRKSWLTYFDDVHSILFVASLSAYDKYLAEDCTINMMVDSLVLFEQIINHPLLDKPSFVLFLNKRDLYDKKVLKVDIVNFFPEYTDKPKSLSRGLSFFKKKFLSQAKKERSIVVHITCCTDTNSMKIIISNLVASVMKENLKDLGIVQ
ncbi:hypothetical protein HDV01_006543 [Terramyces sp. JEL0728]|nr:hypothetical protein HDV01_006543 [Terramyces sp. JEL0728]